jgi:uncharacterized phage-associated protein
MIFVSRKREKLVNAINFFVRNTHHRHTLKLFKLLNFLDFEHYRQTGFGVTGLEYVAWPQGPVPRALWQELRKGGGMDLRKSVAVVPIKDDLTDVLMRRDLKPTEPFRASLFTKRELRIMETLAEIFLDARGQDMSEVSHAKALPWGKIFQDGTGRGKVIPYELAVSSEPIIGSMPSLSDEEIAYRKDAFKELENLI